VTIRFGLTLPRGDWPLLAAGALLLLLAYPPFHLVLPSFVCLVPVVWLLGQAGLDPRPLRRRLVQGFWYGFLSQALVLYWMVFALWHFTPLAAAGYAATIVSFGVFYSVLFAMVGWVTAGPRVPMWLALPVFWTSLEWGVGHLSDISFPWLGLGTSLTGYPTLVQIADLMGARGVTFLLVLANVALAAAWLDRGRPRGAWRMVAVGAGVLAALGYGVWRERITPVERIGTVALIQPNVGFEEKWEPERRRAIFDDLLRLSRRAFAEGEPDLILWPEAAIPQYFPHPWEREIGALAREHRTPILAGGLHVVWLSPDHKRYDHWNAAFLFDSTGSREPYPVYHKRYLVPITERVPFVPPEWFNLPFFGGFDRGERGSVYQVGMGRFGVVVCYESAFEDLARRYRAQGAGFLVNITNDAWFGRTSAPRQHLAHLTMRAIETRMGVARAANTGISGFVDPLGRLSRATPLGVRTVVLGDVLGSPTRPLYVRLGDWVGALSLAGTALLVAYAWWRRR
jgi:apolipoprotein N-acyltransferase